MRPATGNGELYPANKGLRLSTGTIVDATIIAAPSSTKNSKQEGDREMRQTRKGNQSPFGLKTHVGVDSKTVIVHSVCTSAASVSDVHILPDLLHGEEKKVWGDAGYQGQGEVIREAAPHAQDMTSRRAKYEGGVVRFARVRAVFNRCPFPRLGDKISRALTPSSFTVFKLRIFRLKQLLLVRSPETSSLQWVANVA